ncbi:CYTH-like domain-containing protein [Pseudomassariella vexata]|uniref:mRNA-capping enzyme subunit beta n=1 Tax=Pseudomassariella vexata TaxID=1141098 RepID=A0A1Y2EFJ4_9PEZI|nr:CYTH-like domain-containing protein [Pseudomassariella vexata]ORY70358.1 CYTH-like domain-containing protein [Pseudomassariella vexata]
MNNDGDAGGAPRPQSQAPAPAPAPAPTPAPPSQTPSSVGATPHTPIQAEPPPHAFRDYSHSVHASPVVAHAPAPSPHEYGPPAARSGHPPGPYASPTSYHPPPGAFPSRPAPPPLHTSDPRSPGSASISNPSPYRHTPTSSLSAASGGYPFPGQNQHQQPPPSPQQRHQYGPTSVYPRDNYSSQPGSIPPPAGIPTTHGSVSYMQGQQPMPQTPPVGTPGGSNAYLHQRSQSLQSTPTSTPTSAHAHATSYSTSAGTPYAPQVMTSPVATTHQPPAPHYQRQSSQPPTPLGPPLSATSRQQSIAPNNFPQPPSPYQQRTYPPQSQQLHQQTPPPPPQPSSVQRIPSYDAVSEPHRRSQSQQSRSEREHSMSVSPKTRIPSLPSSAGGLPHQTPKNSISMPTMEPQQATTPAKRKMDERDLAPDEREGINRRPPPPEMNGHHQNHVPLPQPKMPPRRYHANKPVWAQSGKSQQPQKSRNFVTKTKSHAVNGTHSAAVSEASRHNSPEASRSVGKPAVDEHPPPPPLTKDDRMMFEGQPFPWQPSIAFIKPPEVVSKEIGDWLFFNVINNPHLHEIQGRGAVFEIEAKLGTIIDRDTNFRVDKQAYGEIILEEGSRVAFRSSMTETQHRKLNEFLNKKVQDSHPANAQGGRPNPNIPIQYKRRRETDRFYELPSLFTGRLPHIMQQLLRTKNHVKARVSYDQKTGDVIAKIVKARVADIHLHLPRMPLDCRISVNLEWDWDGPVEEIEQSQMANRERLPDRNKDRLSYTHGFYQVDLTQVTQNVAAVIRGQSRMEKEHELEVEVDSATLIAHGRRVMEGRESKYRELIDGLLNNVRVLASECPPN